MFGLKIFVRAQTFRRVPPVLPRNFCHPALESVFFGHGIVRKSAFFLKKLSWPELIHPEPEKYFWIVPISTFLLFFLSNMCLFFNFSPPYCSSPQVKKDYSDYICYTCSSVHLLIYSGEEGSPCRASLCRHWQPKARDSLVQRGDACNIMVLMMMLMI